MNLPSFPLSLAVTVGFAVAVFIFAIVITRKPT